MWNAAIMPVSVLPTTLMSQEAVPEGGGSGGGGPGACWLECGNCGSALHGEDARTVFRGASIVHQFPLTAG